MKQRLLLLFFILLLAGCDSPAVENTPIPTANITVTAVAVVSTSTVVPATDTPTIDSSTIDSSTTDQPSSTATSPPIPTLTPSPEPIPEAIIEVPDAILPPGFSMTVYAEMILPTSLAFDAAGRLYATSQDGSVHLFIDTDNDHRADIDSLFFQGLNIPLGITVHDETGDVYVSSNSRLSILRDFDGDLVAEAINFAHSLPGNGRHQNNNLKFGPDGWLYLGMGSSCDVCYEVDERNATIMRFDISTGESEVYATGLRNPYDIAFHPVTGDLFSTDNGRDDLGDEAPHEELNHIVAGGDYGFPDCWDDLQGPGCEGTIPAVAFFEARASTNSIDFYTGDAFPDRYQHTVMAAVLGSWIKLDADRGVMAVTLTANGDTYVGEPTWLAQWDGMPLGLIVGPDGAVYVGDYTNNKIYRISYGN